VLLLAALAYWILQYTILHAPGGNPVLAAAVGRDFKGKFSLFAYAAAIALSPFMRWASCAIYVLVAIVWLVPDPRIERALATEHLVE
jgi:hypothetical protein